MLVLQQGFDVAAIHHFRNLGQDVAMHLAARVVHHRDQHEDHMQRKAFEVYRRQIHFEKGHG